MSQLDALIGTDKSILLQLKSKFLLWNSWTIPEEFKIIAKTEDSTYYKIIVVSSHYSSWVYYKDIKVIGNIIKGEKDE